MQLTYVVPAALFAVTVHASTQLVINEIHHPPDIETKHAEFIELVNTNTSPVDVSEWVLIGGVGFTFANGTVIPGARFR